MNVENTIAKRLNERRAQQAHEACQTNQIHTLLLQDVNHLTIKRFPAQTLRVGKEDVESAFARSLQAGRLFHVADNDSNFGAKLAVVDLLRDGFKIRTSARKEDTDPFHGS